MTKPESNIELLLKVSVYYYNENMTQQEIAGKLGITRQSVSKYLDLAKEQGIVEIKVKNPLTETVGLEEGITRLFADTRLSSAIVVPGQFSQYEIIRHVVAERAGVYLGRLLAEKPFCRIGLSWGRTVRDMITLLPHLRNDSRAEVIPLLGSTDNAIPYFMINEMAVDLAAKINGITRQIFLPLDAERSEDYHHYTATRQYESLLERWRTLDIAFVGIGSDPRRSLTRRSLYPRESEIVENIETLGPVGDICTHYYDIDGTCLSGKQDLLISIPFEVLQKIPRVVGLAGGLDKVRSIAGAIRSGMITDIITDEVTARALVEMKE